MKKREVITIVVAVLVVGLVFFGLKLSGGGNHKSASENPTAPSEEVKPEEPDAETKAEEAVSVSAPFNYEAEGDAVTITRCHQGASGALIIPATIEGNPVTSIGDRAFAKCTNLTGITIPDSVTSIGEGAFGYCRSLTSITIPDSVTSIGAMAFLACKSLTAVTFLGDAPKVAGNAFEKASPTIYRKPEAKGWGETFGGRPVKLISEKP